jgi:predicted transcriptional regulator
MAQKKREGATKRTFRLPDDLMGKLEEIATTERRTMTAQLEVFLWEKVKQYEKSEKPSGNRIPLGA